MTERRGVASGQIGTLVASALLAATAVLAGVGGCGGRSIECESLQTGCNPPPPLPTSSPSRPPQPTRPPVQSTAPAPAPSSSVGFVPIGPTPRPEMPQPPQPTPPPSDPDAEALAAAALAAGCSPQSQGEPAAPDPAPPLCHLATPYYPDSGAECTATWCGNPVRPIRSCTPVPMSFAGGYHYRLSGGGFDADFFFIPYGDPANPTPLKQDFGWVQLTLQLGDTLEPPQPVVMDIYLDSEEAFAAGLDVVDGTIIGSLKLDPLASRAAGPLYQPACDFVSRDLGNTIPGDCACRFPTAALVVPLYVPLGSLLEEPVVDLPPAPDAGVLP